MSCHDLIDRDRFSRQTLNKQTNKTFLGEKFGEPALDFSLVRKI